MSMRAARELAAAGVDSCFSAACRSIFPAALGARGPCCAILRPSFASRYRAAWRRRRRPQRCSAPARWWWPTPIGGHEMRASPPMPSATAARCRRDGRRQGFRPVRPVPTTAALDLGRELMRLHPQADAILFPSPHWPVSSARRARARIRRERDSGVASLASGRRCA